MLSLYLFVLSPLDLAIHCSLFFFSFEVGQYLDANPGEFIDIESGRIVGKCCRSLIVIENRT